MDIYHSIDKNIEITLILGKIENIIIHLIIFIAILLVNYLFNTHINNIDNTKLCSFCIGIIGCYIFDYFNIVIIYLIFTGLVSIYLLRNRNKLFNYNIELGPILLIFFVGNLMYPLYTLIKNTQF